MRCAWLIPAVLIFMDCTPARAQMTVYATDGLTRVRPDDPPLDSARLEISAARNEYEPFQVIVRAGSARLSSVRASAGPFRSGDGAEIDTSNVRIYREHYVRVTKESPHSGEGAGWYPDALIPLVSQGPALRGKVRFAGAPFDVEPYRNQPLWVDVFVPRDARAGRYDGVITITADGEAPTEVSVQLVVWDFTLPETPSLRSNFGKLGTDIADAYGVVMNSAAFQIPEWQYAAALAEHRISPIIPNTLYPVVHDDGSIDPSRTHAGLKRWIEAFHVTGFPLRLLGDDPAGRDAARNVTHLRSMYAYLQKHGWEDMAYVYVLDEPHSAQDYREVRRRAKLVHDAQAGIEVLCTEQPAPEAAGWGTLAGSVDIWVPLWTTFDKASISERLQAGDEAWSYTALMQGRRGRDTPYWLLDFPLLDFRIPMWTSWQYGLTGVLYWSVVNWHKTPDAWTDPATYRVNGEVFNGDGALLYPGVDAGLQGPVVSMRLKQIREGFEDYEYLKLLADRGDRKLAEEVARTIARSWTDWNPDAKTLYDARGAVARYLMSRD
jgi:hypothetical protein